MLFAGVASWCVWLSIPSSIFPPCLLPQSLPVNAALWCFLFIFFLVRRKDILTVENVKAESEEEPRGGPEASVELCVGPGSGLTLD